MSAPDDTPKMSPGTRDVLIERQRQIDAEGYTARHDDMHRHGELARAGAAYALSAAPRRVGELDRALSLWPFDRESFKHQDARACLVVAAALLLAEIDRLDRAFLAPAPTSATEVAK